MAISAMHLSSASVNTLPLGLDGLQIRIAFAPCLNASSSTLASKSNVGGTSGTNIGSQSAMIACAR